MAAQMLEKSIFGRAMDYFESARTLKIEDIRPLDTAGLDRLAKPTAHEEELMRAGYDEVRKILKDAHGRPLTADELRQALKHTNPADVGRWNNCSECAMAVDDILRGRPAVAGNVAEPPSLDAGLDMLRTRIVGAPDDIIAGKSGLASRSGHYGKIEAFLHANGPGTRGVILGQTTPTGGGAVHIGNAANIDSKAYYVDGQVGLVEDFVPTANKYFEYLIFLQTR
jgi:hypothetical protein